MYPEVEIVRLSAFSKAVFLRIEIPRSQLSLSNKPGRGSQRTVWQHRLASVNRATASCR